MASDDSPRHYQGVMVSSTFTDLERHRHALIRTIDAQGLKPLAMEHDSAKPAVDVLDSSLQMVRDAAAYTGVISHKYGQVPECGKRNPEGLSLTELELNEARRLSRPVLLFIMGPDHPVKAGDVEIDVAKKAKLDAFRESAKRLRPDSAVHRVYKVFNDLQDFEVAATQAVGELARYLERLEEPPPQRPAAASGDVGLLESQPVPRPPTFYAEPPYIGTHPFLGRQAQLATLDDWAKAADPHPILLFEAIGGTGKSILTWEWTTRHSANVRGDWAGRFWYSFYDRGAVMADFCRRALAYMSGKPVAAFRKKKTRELGDLLAHHLQAAPWLLVLDGLERVLVAYHRYDAAQLTDEQAGSSDKISNRDPCAAIHPEDDDLLRALAAGSPSKLLLTSRLVPRVLLNLSSQPIPGVRHERLPGLRPADAEALLLYCGVHGNSAAIQSYLQTQCDCHPLVTGALAGLINNYLPDRGNFDAWASDPDGGGSLNLASLDLVQKRSHILHTALAAVPADGRELLSALSLVSDAVDGATLAALNPHLAPLHSPKHLAATQRFADTVRELEKRGLLQYDPHTKRYNLHPVVRGVAAGSLEPEVRTRLGRRLVDHFVRQSKPSYEQTESLADLRNGLEVIRILLQIGDLQQAAHAYVGEISRALLFNLEASSETLSILRPFFRSSWGDLPSELDSWTGGYLANDAAIALQRLGALDDSLAAQEAAMLSALRNGDWANTVVCVLAMSNLSEARNRPARADHLLTIALDLASLVDASRLFVSRLNRFTLLANTGRHEEAEAMWRLLDPMGRDWGRNIYRPGEAELAYAEFRFLRGNLEEHHLIVAEQLAAAAKSRTTLRRLHRLRGRWYLEARDWTRAAESFAEAVRMARQIGELDGASEVQLALAKLELQQLVDPRAEAERLSRLGELDVPRESLAELWLGVGDAPEAERHARRAYDLAWADGPPFVHRLPLDKAARLLRQLGIEPPVGAPYNPEQHAPFPWEDEVAAAIAALRASRQAAGRSASDERSEPPVA
ncbi:MAG TPA: DUF4062 domain-containing protein [Thermoanaerobaculia bacterium]|nr:DUF4062 domain-containing protein [Thermoanaerobaculia bacterium]